ncbi:MAG: primary-amine oxidase [Gammaproteobacteria bacterium]|nr:primary-amine oxidase [Gammaproteobacteria bacterium]
MAQTTASNVPIHPLDPPSAAEVERATALIKETMGKSWGERAGFCSVALVEPAKAALKSFAAGESPGRQLRFLGYDYPVDDPDGGFDATVDLTSGEVAMSRIAKGQAPIGGADVFNAIRIAKQDSGWQAAMRRRGIEDFEHVQIDPWPASGYPHPSIPRGHRAHRCISFVREDKTDNGYARPVQGLIAHVDLTAGRVAHLEDHGDVPLPPESGRYDAASQPRLREGPKPLSITQPEGISFTVDGNAVAWQNWEFRVSLHPINGLVLHQLGYRDAGELRPILHRAALSEMIVPYGDTDPMHRWKHVLDAGEASIGNCANSLMLGCDCLGEIRYLDHVAVKPDGTARLVKNAICIHEEDRGILWKHHDGHSQTTEVRRSRRLVVSSFHTVGNYEYGFYWHLYLDGSIEMEVKLTGIVGVSAVLDGEERAEFAPLVAPNLASPVHQHLFCFRLDFDLDGETNSVYEAETEAVPAGESNPDGTAFRIRSRLLASEKQAMRNVDAARSRCWKVVNPERRNRLGNPVGYRLLPGATPALLAEASSKVAARAAFARHNLWVTPYRPDEICAAGDHPNLNPGGDGLPAWTTGDRSVEATDIVLWHTVGSTHLPRPEDWPVMPVETCGFLLQPVGFFDRNPALDLPPH